MNDLKNMLINTDEVARKLSTRGFSLDSVFIMKTQISERSSYKRRKTWQVKKIKYLILLEKYLVIQKKLHSWRNQSLLKEK